MSSIKRFVKRNSHNAVFKALAGFGRALNRFYENRNHDFHSNGELTVLQKIGKLNPRVIIDGGANLGNYTLQVRKYCPDATIYAFEPVQNTYNKLLSNIEELKDIHPIQAGLYKEASSKKIHIHPSHTHASLYNIQGLSTESVGKEKIALIKGDDFLKERNIPSVDFLKLDIEGGEYDALLGFDVSLRSGKIRVIQFEYGYINITTKNLLFDYYQFFEERGYVVGKIFPKIIEFRKYDFKYEDFLGPNFIAVQRSDVELINSLQNK